MVFQNDYKNCIKLVEKDFEVLDSFLKDYIGLDNNELTGELKDYVTAKSKKIRSALVFLFSRLLYGGVSQNTLKLAAAVELVHNATLIHDDIIDDASLRRGRVTFHRKYDDKLSIIAGDYLLSLAIKLLQETQLPAVISNFADALLNLCNGEINQYFRKFETPDIDTYIKKSKNKTASLFISALTSLAEVNSDKENKVLLGEFAANFGIAFQIHDDLQNILDEKGQKPIYKDIENGIYTAPVIFALSGCGAEGFSAEEITKLAQGEAAIQQTKGLLQKFVEKAQAQIAPLKDCGYKTSILGITNTFFQ